MIAYHCKLNHFAAFIIFNFNKQLFWRIFISNTVYAKPRKDGSQ